MTHSKGIRLIIFLLLMIFALPALAQSDKDKDKDKKKKSPRLVLRCCGASRLIFNHAIFCWAQVARP